MPDPALALPSTVTTVIVEINAVAAPEAATVTVGADSVTVESADDEAAEPVTLTLATETSIVLSEGLGALPAVAVPVLALTTTVPMTTESVWAPDAEPSTVETVIVPMSPVAS